VTSLRILALGTLLAACGAAVEAPAATTTAGAEAPPAETEPAEPAPTPAETEAADNANVDDESALRAEALLFLDRERHVDLDAPREERVAVLESLSELPLTRPGVRDVRDACVSGHRRILEAEAHTAAAREMMAPYGDDRDVPPAEAERVGTAIATSSALISEARPLMDRCHAGVRALNERFRPPLP